MPHLQRVGAPPIPLHWSLLLKGAEVGKSYATHTTTYFSPLKPVVKASGSGEVPLLEGITYIYLNLLILYLLVVLSSIKRFSCMYVCLSMSVYDSWFEGRRVCLCMSHELREGGWRALHWRRNSFQNLLGSALKGPLLWMRFPKFTRLCSKRTSTLDEVDLPYLYLYYGWGWATFCRVEIHPWFLLLTVLTVLRCLLHNGGPSMIYLDNGVELPSAQWRSIHGFSQ